MSSYSYFSPEAVRLTEQYNLKNIIEEFAESHQKQTYVLQKPLSKDDSIYDYENAIVVFISGLKPCFINFGEDKTGFQDYMEDFIDDLSFLSEKFGYREKIGRKKNWLSCLTHMNFNDFDFSNLEVDSASDKRIVDLLASLVVGSINDINRINLKAENLLDIVKSKIILFDTDQTSFVFKTRGEKKFVIQGLAGSGKTELLLHKLKEIYSKESDARIAFTCYNKILAASMRNRIPDFFDFMRVERQIDWGNKLHCFHSWGSAKNPLSGMYRYICYSYGIPFGSFQAGSFEDLCTKAISDIEKIPGEVKHILDYTFIDESQDFPKSFFDLCELVTSKKVFVAGDVFQNIFRPIDDEVSRADMVLKKCYRTDPTNLMFSHAVGMGLFETPVLRWLKDAEWDACGYSYITHEDRAHISRDPLRRFEDIPADYQSTSVHVADTGTETDTLLGIIDNILQQNPTAKPGDFAVIFVDKSNYIYDEISRLKNKIIKKYGWEVNISYETKENDPNKLFISNLNNAKGLEFPFVICFAKSMNRNTSFRNALYTMMARSFLESHLVFSAAVNMDIVKSLRAGLKNMFQNGYMDVRIPSDEEISSQKEYFVLEEQDSIEIIVRRFCTEKNATPRLAAKLVNRIETIVSDIDYDEEYLLELLNLEYERFKIL